MPGADRAAAIVLLSAATVTIAASPVFSYGVLAPILNTEFGLSPTQIGALSTVFHLVGAVSTTWTGRATDRLGARAVTLGILCLAALSHLLFSIAPLYVLMLISAVIGGVAIGASNPSTNLLLAERLSEKSIGLGTGLKQAGVPTAAVLAGAALPSMAAALGWRGAAASLAVLSLIVMAVVWMTLRPERRPARRYKPLPAAGVTRQIRMLAGFAGLMGGATGVANSQLALYATNSLDFSPASAGALFAAFGLAGLLRILWAQIAGRMAHPQRLLIALGLMAAASCFVLEVADGMPAWFSWVGVLMLGMSGLGWQGVAMITVIRTSAREQLGFQSGYVMRTFFIGLFSTPILFGLWVDYTGSYVGGWAAIGCLGLLAAMFAKFAHGKAG